MPFSQDWKLDTDPASIGSTARATATPAGPVVASDGMVMRLNEGKPPFDLLPAEALEALANLYGAGAKKYAARRWERGMSMCVCFGAMMRHAWKWMRGEDFDEEAGTHHMIAVAWNAFAIFIYQTRGVGTDDRPGKAVPA